MVAALSPADYNYEESLSTLHYANRAKSIKNKPRINEDPKDALLKEYEQEIKQLRLLLQQMSSTGASGQQMNAAIAQMQNSMKAQNMGYVVEEDADTLIRKLEGQGKRVKIINDDEEEELTDKKSKKKKGKKRQDTQVEEEEEVEEDSRHVMFQEKLKALENLEIEKQYLHADKERIQGELSKKEDLLRIEAQEKTNLEQLIKEMEHKLVNGGQALEEREKEQAKAYREYQAKLKAQRKK